MAPNRRLPVLLGILVLALAGAPGTSAQSSPAPSADPDPVPSAVPVPTWPDADAPGDGGPTPGVLAWEAAGPPFQHAGRDLFRLVAWSGGFAALESRDDPRVWVAVPAIWSSSDGREWARGLLPKGIRVNGVMDMLAFKGGLVIVTDETPDIRGRGFDIAFWRSDDAVTWRRTGAVSYRVPPDLARLNCQANHRDVAAIDGALMLYVGLCWDSCCGFRPSPANRAWAMLPRLAQAGRDRPTNGVIAWRSRDGRTWSEQPLTGLTSPDVADYGFGPFEGRGELYALRSSRSGDLLLRSVDGIRWAPFGTLPADLDPIGLSHVFILEDALLQIGESPGVPLDANGAPLFSWRIGADETSAPTPFPRAYVVGVIVDGDTVLAVGRASGEGPTFADEDNPEWAWIVGSRDGGRTWDPTFAWTGGDGSCLSEVAQRGRTVVAIACTPDSMGDPQPAPRTPQLWVAELPSSSPAP